MAQRAPIPVVDLFAGPGGLGEGFSSLADSDGQRLFKIEVSIEKDAAAHRTLALRALFRSFPEGKAPDAYYDYVRGNITREELVANADMAQREKAALEEARCAELGKTAHQSVDAWIRKAVGKADQWVLIGGPPCQAYSLAGRSRLRPNNEQKFEEDHRHLLYKEYLRVIRLFGPSVFVMENVKGLLTSKHGGSPIFERILSDLREPGGGASYEIRSLVVAGHDPAPADYLIESERFGVPQCRHRVILFGIRSDLAKATELSDASTRFKLRAQKTRVSVRTALSGIPPLRSRLSERGDSEDAWMANLWSAPGSLKDWRKPVRPKIEAAMKQALAKAATRHSTGGQFDPSPPKFAKSMPKDLRAWLEDSRLGGVLQHEARRHMATDLHRYMFAACFARVGGHSPKLSAFPPRLMPDHRNVDDEKIPFVDRFKVQMGGYPSSTVVSHICKDGHYFIHFDPSQCRSLTVREAARLQTFPDNYFFEGNRTQQYHQVGNAVPPWLARQIAQVVADFMAA